MERTLVVFKPDAVQRGIVGEVLSRFEKVGLKIIAMKMVNPDEAHYYHHYETIGKMVSRRGEAQFRVQLGAMQEGPVIAMVLEGVSAVKQVRKMVGTTSTNEAAPGTIRGDYAHASLDHVNTHNVALPTILHASGDPDEAAQEIEHWFNSKEIFADYQTVHEYFTQPMPAKTRK
ncbi:MAG TPA: nucleoside-diphosphate kinase [Candidatus Chromulinivoraceae bacterium]|nr:nucleoside-diphosphate kinase [Candidatus Chromulinivoraceae bacterium]